MAASSSSSSSSPVKLPPLVVNDDRKPATSWHLPVFAVEELGQAEGIPLHAVICGPLQGGTIGEAWDADLGPRPERVLSLLPDSASVALAIVEWPNGVKHARARSQPQHILSLLQAQMLLIKGGPQAAGRRNALLASWTSALQGRALLNVTPRSWVSALAFERPGTPRRSRLTFMDELGSYVHEDGNADILARLQQKVIADRRTTQNSEIAKLSFMDLRHTEGLSDYAIRQRKIEEAGRLQAAWNAFVLHAYGSQSGTDPAVAMQVEPPSDLQAALDFDLEEQRSTPEVTAFFEALSLSHRGTFMAAAARQPLRSIRARQDWQEVEQEMAQMRAESSWEAQMMGQVTNTAWDTFVRPAVNRIATKLPGVPPGVSLLDNSATVAKQWQFKVTEAHVKHEVFHRASGHVAVVFDIRKVLCDYAKWPGTQLASPQIEKGWRGKLMLDAVQYSFTGAHKHRTTVGLNMITNRLLASSLIDMLLMVYTTCPDKNADFVQAVLSPFLDDVDELLQDESFMLPDHTGTPYPLLSLEWALDGAAYCMAGRAGATGSSTPLPISGATLDQIYDIERVYIPNVMHEASFQVNALRPPSLLSLSGRIFRLRSHP